MEQKHKKIFISYSWSNQKHQNWVTNLATRLREDSVDVIYDKWSLKAGHDKYQFMEEMVNDKDIYRVLIISDETYTQKADERKGGVGTETQIITPSIYNKVKQEKFIPIVRERNEDGEAYLPTFLKTRIYYDFSNDEDFENRYEELLRNILEAPALPKPKLGKKPPAYITESTVSLSETNNKLKSIKNQISKTGTISTNELNNFSNLFLEKLWEFQLASKSNDIDTFGNDLVNNLRSFKPLREDFITFVNIISSTEIENPEELLIEFFEKRPVYERPKDENISSWRSSNFENFKIIFHELFIYTIAVCLKNKNYQLIADLFHSRYYTQEKYRVSTTPETFTFLYKYHENLENYYSSKYNKITGFGDYVVSNLSESLKKQEIILADTLCYFVSYLISFDVRGSWFPATYLYGEQLGPKIFFEKMTSLKHFEKTKSIFNVNNKKELSDRLKEYAELEKRQISYGRGFEIIPFINDLINPETIGIYR